MKKKTISKLKEKKFQMIIIQSYFVNEHSTVWNQRIKIVDFVLNEKRKKENIKKVHSIQKTSAN